jgi:hypothetical protein
MAGVSIGYDTDGLQRGSGLHTRARATCATVTQALAGITMSAAIFGAVPAAAGFHSAAAQTRDGQVRDADVEATRRGDLAGRAAGTAVSGAQLTADTTDLARSVPVAPAGPDRR